MLRENALETPRSAGPGLLPEVPQVEGGPGCLEPSLRSKGQGTASKTDKLHEEGAGNQNQGSHLEVRAPGQSWKMPPVLQALLLRGASHHVDWGRLHWVAGWGQLRAGTCSTVSATIGRRAGGHLPAPEPRTSPGQPESPLWPATPLKAGWGSLGTGRASPGHIWAEQVSRVPGAGLAVLTTGSRPSWHLPGCHPFWGP